MRMRVQCLLASLSGLRIRHCRELWCKLQTQFGSRHSAERVALKKSVSGTNIKLDALMQMTRSWFNSTLQRKKKMYYAVLQKTQILDISSFSERVYTWSDLDIWEQKRIKKDDKRCCDWHLFIPVWHKEKTCSPTQKYFHDYRVKFTFQLQELMTCFLTIAIYWWNKAHLKNVTFRVPIVAQW